MSICETFWTRRRFRVFPPVTFICLPTIPQSAELRTGQGESVVAGQCDCRLAASVSSRAVMVGHVLVCYV